MGEMADEMFDMGMSREFEREQYEKARGRYELLDNTYIINRLIQYGEDANNVTEYFPAYDVALKCRGNSDEATVKQHNAMAHCLAYIDTAWS